jgi:hypothetical protein
MTPPTIEPSARRSGGRAALAVVGALAALLALVVLLGGAALVGMHETKRDTDGYYSSGSNRLTTPTHALVSDSLDIDTKEPNWLFSHGRLGTIRLTTTDTTKPIFIGVARQSQVDAYLKGVPHDVVTDFELDPFSYEHSRRTGTTTPAAPTEQDFWATSASGDGEQTLTWPVEKGTWAVVVMNADGSNGVDTDVSVGAKVPAVLWIGVGLLAVGGLLAAFGAAAIYYGARKPRRAPSLAAGSENATVAPAVGR